LLDELPRVGVHRVEEPALPLREEQVKRQRTLAAAADPGDDDEFAARDFEREVLEIVLAGALDGDDTSLERSRGNSVLHGRILSTRLADGKTVSRPQV